LDAGYNVEYFLMHFLSVKREQVLAVLEKSCRSADHEARAISS
jgi:hypothetical protein